MSKEMGLRLDESGWPIVVGVWQGTLTDEELTHALTAIDRWLARRERFGLLIDTRGGGGLGPDQRNRLIAHMKTNAGVSSKYLVQATVIDNVLQRTLFYAVNLVFPNPFPAKVFSHPESARAWLLEKLAEPPPSD
jgi:hypothetical protein